MGVTVPPATKLAQIEAREVGTGPRFLTLWEQSALVEIAKAAQTVAGQFTMGGYIRVADKRDVEALRAALARLGGGAEEPTREQIDRATDIDYPFLTR